MDSCEAVQRRKSCNDELVSIQLCCSQGSTRQRDRALTGRGHISGEIEIKRESDVDIHTIAVVLQGEIFDLQYFPQLTVIQEQQVLGLDRKMARLRRCNTRQATTARFEVSSADESSFSNKSSHLRRKHRRSIPRLRITLVHCRSSSSCPEISKTNEEQQCLERSCLLQLRSAMSLLTTTANDTCSH